MARHWHGDWQQWCSIGCRTTSASIRTATRRRCRSSRHRERIRVRGCSLGWLLCPRDSCRDCAGPRVIGITFHKRVARLVAVVRQCVFSSPTHAHRRRKHITHTTHTNATATAVDGGDDVRRTKTLADLHVACARLHLIRFDLCSGHVRGLNEQGFTDMRTV